MLPLPEGQNKPHKSPSICKPESIHFTARHCHSGDMLTSNGYVLDESEARLAELEPVPLSERGIVKPCGQGSAGTGTST